MKNRKKTRFVTCSIAWALAAMMMVSMIFFKDMTMHVTAKENTEQVVQKIKVTPYIEGTVTKAYDGTTAVPDTHNLRISLSDGSKIIEDNLIVKAQFAYSSRDEGTNIKVFANNITLSGESAVNYELTQNSASADIGEITHNDNLLDASMKETQMNTNSSVNNESHNFVHMPATDPSEEKEGNTEYWYCSKCGKYFADAAGSKEIAKDSWILPYVEEEIAIEIGEEVAIDEIMNGTSTFEKMELPKASQYEKYLTIDSKTGTITTKKYYKKKIKNSIPVKITAAGKEYIVNVSVVIPAPKVTIKRSIVKHNGTDVYKYTFKYNVKDASKIKVRLKEGGTTAINKELDQYVKNPKSNKNSYIMFTKKTMERLKNKITFQIVAYYGNNQSDTRVITK